MICSLSLSEITADPRAQSRSGLNHDVVGEYAEAMGSGAVFPPLVVFRDEETHWLAEGFHRFEAARQADLGAITCDVLLGGLREAILHSVGSNATHGLRRTNEDKRRSVRILLEDPLVSTDPKTGAPWSDNSVSRQCAVSVPFVGNVRRSLLTVNSDSSTRAYRDRWGNISQMGTAAIGRKPVADEVSPEGASTGGVTASAAAPTTQTGTCSAGDGDPLVGRQDPALARQWDAGRA